jgi:hypothetical protein
VGHGTPTWQDSAQRVAEHFAIADQLAIRLQAVYLKAWAAILCLSFAAAITLQVHLNAVGGWVLSVIYGGLIVIAFSVYYAVKRLRIEEQYLDYRALAEGLRIQMHWLESGLADPVARFYLHRQHSELKWIRSAIRNWTFCQTHLHAASDARADINERISAISTEWLSGQRAYFSKAASKARRSERIWTWAARLLVVVGVLLAVIKSAFDPSPWLVVLVAAPPILVAIFTLHVQNRKFGPLSQQATRMAALFDCAVMRLQDIRDTPDGLSDDFDELLRQLGREVLAENAEWVILHRDRPISTPFVA